VNAYDGSQQGNSAHFNAALDEACARTDARDLRRQHRTRAQQELLDNRLYAALMFGKTGVTS